MRERATEMKVGRRMARIFLCCSPQPWHCFHCLPAVKMTVAPRPAERKDVIVERAQTESTIGMLRRCNIVAREVTHDRASAKCRRRIGIECNGPIEPGKGRCKIAI